MSEDCLAFETFGRDCLASEPCVSDEECEGDGFCVQAFTGIPIAELGLDDAELALETKICSSTEAELPYQAFAFLMFVMVTAASYCIYLALSKARKVRRALIKRRALKRKGGKKVANGTTPLQKKAEDVLEKSRDIAFAFDAALEDVRKLALRDDMMQALFMFQSLTLATMGLTHRLGQNNYQEERKLYYILAYLESATSGMTYAMDRSVEQAWAIQGLKQSQQLLVQTATYFNVPCPGTTATALMTKRHGDSQYGLYSPYMQQLEAVVLAYKPAFRGELGEVVHARMFAKFRRFKLFYGFLLTWMVIIFMQFAVKINTDNATLDGDNELFLGGMGQTFLPVPPQYDIAANKAQGVIIPILFGIMHNALLFLGILPLPMCRGFIRDLVDKFPNIRRYAPVDDLPALHRFFAYTMLGLLFLGASIWLPLMIHDCNANIPKACLTFTPAVKNQLDPIENVFMLRVAVLTLWPFMAVLYFARSVCPWPLNKSRVLREHWFELCYFSHTIIAHVTLVMALVSRTEVFYPVLVGWSVYWFDYMRETVFFTKRATLVDSQLFGRSKDGVPTSMRLKFKTHGSLKTGAGQYAYIKIPAIDQVWHPFTLCNASNDETIQVHVGLIQPPGESKWSQTEGQYGQPEWTSSARTWTYKLFKLVSKGGNRRDNVRIEAKVRGPYGSAFYDMFSDEFGGTCIIAAGTGLSAAESVLRESLEKRKAGLPGPAKLWLVFACRDEDSLIWVWERTISLLVKAVDDGVLNINTLSSNSAMFDWIGVQMYVTKTTPAALKTFSELNSFGKAFNLRESIFQRRTLSHGKKKAGARVKNDGGMGKGGMGGPSASSLGPAYYNGQQQGAMEGGMQQGGNLGGPQLAAQRAAIMSTSMGQYSTLESDFSNMNQQRAGNDAVTKRVSDWVMQRVNAGSLDDGATHIESYLEGAVEALRAGNLKNSDLSVGFCGPGPLSLTLDDACRTVAHKLRTKIKFSSENQ